MLATLAIAGTLLLLTFGSSDAAPYYPLYGSISDNNGDPIPEVTLSFTCNSTGQTRDYISYADGSITGMALALHDYRDNKVRQLINELNARSVLDNLQKILEYFYG